MSTKKLFGTEDKDQEYPISQAEKEGFYLVRHFHTAGLRGDLADPATFNYQFYSPEVYDEYTRESEAEGKENTFNLMGGKYIVLNKPTGKTEEPAPLKAFTVSGVKFIPSEDGTKFESEDGKHSVDVVEGEDYKDTAKKLVNQN